MKIRYYLIKLIKNHKIGAFKTMKECWMGWLGLGLRWVGCCLLGGWDGFDWKKVNLLRGIFVSSSYIVFCLILMI